MCTAALEPLSITTMSLARAFTKRSKRPEVSAPMAYRDGQIKFSSGTIKRGKISGPVELLSTTNMLAYNAPDLNSAVSSSSSSSSLRSPDDSELAFSPQSNFGSPVTTPDQSPQEVSPIEPNSPASYFPKRSATVANSRSSGSTTSSTEAPMVPRRALSHTKRSHQALARQRSLSRLEPPPLSAARTTGSNRDSPPDASLQPPEAHPFGKELEQVNEVAEEFGGTTRGVDEEENLLFHKGLKKFTADDYLIEVNNVYGSIFDDQLGPISVGPWL